MLDLSKLSVPDTKLIQHGLAAVGFYNGTKEGKPGPKTAAAYARWLASFDTLAQPQLLTSTIDRLCAIARAEIGVREEPKDSNRGARVQEYQSATNLDGTGWAWCAAFIDWCIWQLEKEGFNTPFERPQTALAYGFETWAKNQNLVLLKPRKKILKGDIIMFTSFSHVALAVEDEANGYVKTVEGNTSSSGSREGGGVYTLSRKTSLVRSHVRLQLK